MPRAICSKIQYEDETSTAICLLDILCKKHELKREKKERQNVLLNFFGMM